MMCRLQTARHLLVTQRTRDRDLEELRPYRHHIYGTLYDIVITHIRYGCGQSIIKKKNV